MRGKLARALRRITGFDPRKKRQYMRAHNGIIFETIKSEDGTDTIITKRSIYRLSKKQYMREK
ncbi:MAG: hypothetical protein Unbinned8261contig1001_17 [Prokaryotic dsDNA virus sp.]|nr:MAG: hypothetical protein Unbinned8261contig1001_17 [Prokaryotic dsDNA virus sp.]